MKKILSLVLIIVSLFAGLVLLTGCNDKKDNGGNAYNKEVETHKVKTSDGTAEISFEFEKSNKYLIGTGANSIVIKNSQNYAEVKVTALHDSILSSTVTKKEKDFGSNFHDYKEVKVGSYYGWEIYEGESSYKSVLVLNDKDESNRVYAVKIEVIKSPIMKENMSFDTAEFVKGQDFQHLLNSIKLSVN